MVARLRPDELAQLNEILGTSCNLYLLFNESPKLMSCIPVDTSGGRHDPQHYINLNLEGGTFSNNYYSGIVDGIGLFGRDDGLDRGHSPTDDDLPGMCLLSSCSSG